jgi:hypothetical protein
LGVDGAAGLGSAPASCPAYRWRVRYRLSGSSYPGSWVPRVIGAAAVHGRIRPSLPSTRRGTRAYAAGCSKRRTASARTLTTWWRCRTGFPVDWTQDTQACQDPSRSCCSQHSRCATPLPTSSTIGGDHGWRPGSSSFCAATGLGYEITFYRSRSCLPGRMDRRPCGASTELTLPGQTRRPRNSRRRLVARSDTGPSGLARA